jgi:hypothetical protein
MGSPGLTGSRNIRVRKADNARQESHDPEFWKIPFTEPGTQRVMGLRLSLKWIAVLYLSPFHIQLH